MTSSLKRSPAFEGHRADPGPIKKKKILFFGTVLIINNSICSNRMNYSHYLLSLKTKAEVYMPVLQCL